MTFVRVVKQMCENICVGGNGCGLFGQIGVGKENQFCFKSCLDGFGVNFCQLQSTI